jgi:GH24 family phage-related lysozyme (muramidase)
MVAVSDVAAAMIAAAEISSASYYNQCLTRPTWPGGASGITIGIGYDLGYEDRIAEDWKDLVPASMLRVMLTCQGVKGASAKARLAGVRPGIAIPYPAAMKVFSERTLPRYARATELALPNCDVLSGDSFGALVSISYNRGPNGWTMLDDRHREMAQIYAAMRTEDYGSIPGLIRGMRRLWLGPNGQPLQGMAGLLTRRDTEAALFESGLTDARRAA